MKSTLAVLSLGALVAATTVVSYTSTSVKAPFVEQFGADWEERWKPSEAAKELPADAPEPEVDLYRYRGEWSVESAKDSALPGGKQGLVVKTPAAHHAISAAFPQVLDPAGKDLVIQYDLKLQDGLECGGAYIKLLSESKDGINYKEFDDKTPYTIMFGPDKCGSTNKVHFIFRHRNPKTGVFEEKHLVSPPAIVDDRKSNLYTLIVRPDNTFQILINNKESAAGSLLEKFEPPVNPPKEIDDPSDKKPEDWVDQAQIADPEATKPEDWDEDAPRMIPDEDAVKPEDWLEEEPKFVADPAAVKPADWDDEEDGEWVAPQVPNPKCEKAAGCGEWTRPNKVNPAYKGKWTAPMIANPEYKGPWAPRKIPNPNYFEDKEPANFNKIMGVGIELWTMQAGIMFDNFYIGHSVDDAKQLAEETWAKKQELEKVKEEADAAKAKEEMEKAEANKPDAEKEDSSSEPATIQEQALKFVNKYKKVVLAFVNAFTADPVAAVKKEPFVALALLLVLLSPTFLLLSTGKSSTKDKDYAKAKKKDVTPKDDPKEETDDVSAEGDDEQEETKPRRRQVARDE